MTDNTMREALIKFGDENPALDLDFRLHTHGKYLTQEKAIVASRAFKAGAAWQAAQSVPVLGPPVAWVNINKHGDITRTVSRRDNWCTTSVYRKPTNSILASELATLREKAAMVDELQKRAERMQKALSDIAEWTDRYTTPGHPVSTIARAAIAQCKGE